MAVTWALTVLREGVASDGKKEKFVSFSPTGTYTTGGDAFTPASIGLKGVTRLLQEGSEGLANPGFNTSLMGTTEAPLLKLYDANATEIPGATSITGRLVFAFVRGF